MDNNLLREILARLEKIEIRLGQIEHHRPEPIYNHPPPVGGGYTPRGFPPFGFRPEIQPEIYPPPPIGGGYPPRDFTPGIHPHMMQ